jgi:hypothetical protein
MILKYVFPCLGEKEGAQVPHPGSINPSNHLDGQTLLTIARESPSRAPPSPPQSGESTSITTMVHHPDKAIIHLAGTT